MGKTVTAELATFSPGKSRNPHNCEHTPGGSSSGSAAAVASYMVAGALGTQTNGSMIRPASFCGTIGFKPSYGLISRQGILRQSPFLDQVGVYARSISRCRTTGGGPYRRGPGRSCHQPHLRCAPVVRYRQQESPPLPPNVCICQNRRMGKSQCGHSGRYSATSRSYWVNRYRLSTCLRNLTRSGII